MTNLILMASSLTRNATGLMVVLVLLFGISATISTAQTYTDLHDFNCSKEGCNPQFPAQLAQGRDGNLYGTMPKGGTFNFGTFFKATTGGIISVPYTFDGNNGSGRVPRSGVTLGTDGYLYGATVSGGQAAGTIFKITPAGTISTLHSFTGQNGTTCPSTEKPDGGSPYAPPIRGKDGFYYGVTSIGTAYRITSSGTFTPLCSPSVLIPFGALSPVVQAMDGNFYATSTSGNGTVFRFSPSGVAKIIHSFIFSEGSSPVGPVVQGSDGNLYGTTATGGPLGSASGTIFKLSLSGTLTPFHAFDRNNKKIEGYGPKAGLLEATDGNLYGSTQFGGDPVCNCGVLFKITKSGVYTVLHTFHSGEPSQPEATQIQHTNGKIYGLANGPHYSDGGSLYSLAVGLKPFVKLMTLSGKSGQTVQILGQGFSGTTAVKFGTGSANFTVVSDTYLIALVPATGTTGLVTVTTSSGTLASNKTFKVIPTITSFSPTIGPVGTQVIINGTGLTQTTKVTFGGVNATTFTVNSATKVTATVPTGAVDGKIAITTPGGSATSAETFTVHRLAGRCVVSNGKLTGYCIGELGGICHEAYDPTHCVQGQSVPNVVLFQCHPSTFTIDGSSSCVP